MTAAALPLEKRPVPLSSRLLAAAGFVLAIALAVLFVSQQIAVEKARGYLKSRYKTNVEVPVKSIRPDFLFEAPETGKAVPPLGFCWTIEVDTGVAGGEVMVNPWNHEVVDWRVDL